MVSVCAPRSVLACVLLSLGLVVVAAAPVTAWRLSSFLPTLVRAQAPAGACAPPIALSNWYASLHVENKRSHTVTVCATNSDGGPLRPVATVAAGTTRSFNGYSILHYPCVFLMERAHCEGMALGTFSPQQSGASKSFVLAPPAPAHESTTTEAREAEQAKARSDPSNFCKCEELPPGGQCLDELPAPGECHIRDCVAGYRCTDAGTLNCVRTTKEFFLKCNGRRSGNKCLDCERVDKVFEMVQYVSN